VIDFLAGQREGARIEKIGIEGANASEGLAAYGGREFHPAVKDCARLYPHRWDCQPFFVAKIGKAVQ
jgi:16S rRNA C967 or C1407 C5-methylase (RsmB/RsmF family)